MLLMTTSKKGLELIKEFEGFRENPYLCSSGVPTIGFGTTVYPNGQKVTLRDMPVDKNQAELFLKNDVKKFENAVNGRIKRALNQNQFDALISITYNIGDTAFEESTLAKRIDKDPNDPNIQVQFLRWNKSDGVVNAGLIKRRKKEAKLYFTPVV